MTCSNETAPGQAKLLLEILAAADGPQTFHELVGGVTRRTGQVPAHAVLRASLALLIERGDVDDSGRFYGVELYALASRHPAPVLTVPVRESAATAAAENLARQQKPKAETVAVAIAPEPIGAPNPAAEPAPAILPMRQRVVEDVAGLLAAGHDPADVARWCYVGSDELEIAGRWRQKVAPLPSPTEIYQRAAQIRATWTDADFALRSRGYIGIPSYAPSEVA